MKNLLFLVFAIMFFSSCEKNVESDTGQEYRMVQNDNNELSEKKGRASCDDFDFYINTIEKKDNCCTFSISVVPKDSFSQGVVVDYFVDGQHVSSINVVNPVAIPLELCYDESKVIEFYVNGELCFSEKVFCADCCSHYTYNLTKEPEGDCCQFSLEVYGPIDCVNAVDISVVGNPGSLPPGDVVISGNTATITLCDTTMTAAFHVSIFGESCWESELLNVYDCN